MPAPSARCERCVMRQRIRVNLRHDHQWWRCLRFVHDRNRIGASDGFRESVFPRTRRCDWRVFGELVLTNSGTKELPAWARPS